MSRLMIVVLAVLALVVGRLAGAEEKKPEPKLLNSFETEADAKAFTGSVKAERVQEHATDGKWALKVFIPGSPKDTWPGLNYALPVQDLSPYDVLSFDVYNPAEKPIDFAVRVDDASKQGQFVMLKLKAKAVTTVDIWIKGLRPKLDPTKITKIYPYRSKPHDDCTLYLDNFRLGFALDRFKEIKFVEDAAMPPLPEADQQRGYVLFKRHTMAYVMPNSVPKPEELNPRLDLFAAQGEREPVALSVRALQDLKQAMVTVTDLGGPEGKKIAAGQVDVRIVRCLNRRLTYPSFEYMLTPTYLETARPEDIARDTSRCFWLTVNVPADAAPGIYQGEAAFTAQGRPEARVPLRVRVLPFKLEDVRGLAFAPYYRPWNVKALKGDAERKAFIRRDLQDMRDHGMTSVGLCVGLDSNKFTVKDGKVDLGMDGTSEFEMVMDAYRDLRFPEPICLLADSAQTYAGANHPLDSKEFAEDYKLMQSAINAEAKKRGWPEIIQQPVDEPAWQGQADMDRTVRCLKVLKDIPGQRTEQDGPGDKFFHEIAGPFADVWNYNGAYAERDVLKKAKAQGHLIWIYNNDVEGFRPETERYAAGYHLAASGTDGVYNWEYRGGGGDLYDDFDSAAGDFVMWYLPNEKSTGGPSIGWEGFREGIDDQKYIALLRKTIVECRRSHSLGAASAAKRAQKLLDEILSSIDYKSDLRSTSRWDSTSVDAEGRKQVHGQYKVPNGWDMAAYDIARWRIAEAIMAMKVRLNELPREALPASKPQPKGAPVTVVSVSMDAGPATKAARPVAKGGRPSLAVSQTNEPVRIDGKLDDAVWRRPPDIASFVTSDGKSAPSQQTQVWVTFDSNNLYVAARCQEKLMDKLVASVREDLGNVWSDDCIEVFVDAAHDRKGFFQVAVNSLGFKYLSLIAERAKASQVKTAATVGKDSWCCEIAIPLTELGAMGSDMGFNVCRERRAGGGVELSCWSPTLEGFARPDRFGDLTLGGKYLKGVRLGELLAGANEALVTVRNDGASKETFVVDSTWTETPAGQAAARPKDDWGSLFSRQERGESAAVTLEPGAAQEVKAPFQIPRGDRSGDLEVAVRQLPGCEVVASRRTTISVPPMVGIKLRPAVLYAQDSRLAVTLTLNTAPETLKGAALEVGLGGLFFPRTLKRIEGIIGRQVTVVLDVSGVGIGEHKIFATLTRTGPQGISVTETAKFEKIQGPME